MLIARYLPKGVKDSIIHEFLNKQRLDGLFLCRKVKFGKNNNLTRFEVISEFKGGNKE